MRLDDNAPGQPRSLISRGRELRDFLVARRARISPAEYQLAGGRRRTPGLRRSEVAALAAVSEDWYRRFEQGRNFHVSSTMVGRVASVLKLDPVERAYLFRLVGFDEPDVTSEQTNTLAELQQVIDAYAHPAAVYTRWYDVLIRNQPFAETFGPPTLDDSFSSNTIWRMFFDPARRGFYADWERSADQAVAFVRFAMASYGDRPRFMAVFEALMAHPDFAKRWKRGAVDDPLHEAVTYEFSGDTLSRVRVHVFPIPGHNDWLLILTARRDEP
jgi:hypothetical protein